MGTTYTIESETLTEIADAIRSKTGSSEEILTVDMAGEIMGISGGGSDIWSGTHAEYEAEKTNIDNGTLICFNDDLGLEVGSEYYSETEQIIGTYEGKPLYRKIFKTTVSGTGTRTITFSDEDIILRSINGFACSGNYDSQYRVPINFPSYFDSVYQDGYRVIKFTQNQPGYNYITLLIEYTKPNDSVVGVIGGIKKGDNYSTTEQVIGTWLGKPLYQKTFDYGTLPNNAVKDVSHGIANVSKIWVYDGFCYQPNGDYFAQLINTAPSGTADNKGEWYFGCSSTFIRCLTAQDRTNYSAYVTLRYTKTTD